MAYALSNTQSNTTTIAFNISTISVASNLSYPDCSSTTLDTLKLYVNPATLSSVSAVSYNGAPVNSFTVGSNANSAWVNIVLKLLSTSAGGPIQLSLSSSFPASQVCEQARARPLFAFKRCP